MLNRGEAYAPKLLLPCFTLPNALPGSPQWTNPIPDGGSGYTRLTLIQLICRVTATITIHKVPPSGSASNSNIICPALALFAGETGEFYYDESLNTIPAGYSMYFFASAANAVNCELHGIVFQG